MSADRELGPEATVVVQACERLVSDLRYYTTAGARMSISDLKEALPALETVLTEMRHAEMLAAVAAAAGAARTHEWAVTNVIHCPRCNLTAVDHALTRGAVPECGSGEPCTYNAGHVVVMGDGNGGMRCTYCKTVYPATAPVPGRSGDTAVDDSMKNLLSHVPPTEAAMTGITDEMIAKGADAIADLLTMLGVDPGERIEHNDAPPVARQLAELVLQGGLAGA